MVHLCLRGRRYPVCLSDWPKNCELGRPRGKLRENIQPVEKKLWREKRKKWRNVRSDVDFVQLNWFEWLGTWVAGNPEKFAVRSDSEIMETKLSFGWPLSAFG